MRRILLQCPLYFTVCYSHHLDQTTSYHYEPNSHTFCYRSFAHLFDIRQLRYSQYLGLRRQGIRIQITMKCQVGVLVGRTGEHLSKRASSPTGKPSRSPTHGALGRYGA